MPFWLYCPKPTWINSEEFWNINIGENNGVLWPNAGLYSAAFTKHNQYKLKMQLLDYLPLMLLLVICKKDFLWAKEKRASRSSKILQAVILQ